MQKQALVLLMVIGSVLWLGGCATVAQNTHPEIMTTPAFTIKRGSWFNSKAFDMAMEQQKAKLNAPGHVLELFDSTLPNTKPMEIQMKGEIKRGQGAFISLGFYIKNPNTNISFHAGGLIMTLRGPQGTVEVRDRGCLFVYYKGVKGTCYDSSKGEVNFNRDFNNRPDYKVKPNVIWVRVDPQYSNWELVSLTIDPQKIFIKSPVATRSE